LGPEGILGKIFGMLDSGLKSTVASHSKEYVIYLQRNKLKLTCKGVTHRHSLQGDLQLRSKSKSKVKVTKIVPIRVKASSPQSKSTEISSLSQQLKVEKGSWSKV